MTTYRILVTGSRDWRHAAAIHRGLDEAHIAHLMGDEGAVPIVVHGAARGADAMAHWYATQCNWQTEPHPADWNGLGRRAGMVRNAHMVQLGADLCLAFVRDHSRGASACAALAERAGIETIRIHDCDCHPGEVTR